VAPLTDDRPSSRCNTHVAAPDDAHLIARVSDEIRLLPKNPIVERSESEPSIAVGSR
jgi:hypothetical protein